MKMKTEGLTGLALDWAVAKCEGKLGYKQVKIKGSEFDFEFRLELLNYSSEWSSGGPILEREEIEITVDTAHAKYDGQELKAHIYPDTTMYGRTYLEVAMRCYVASKLGNEIEIPEELI